jgi:hypothetical protein
MDVAQLSPSPMRSGEKYTLALYHSLLSRGSEHLREVARVRVYGEWEKWKKQARPVIMTDKRKEKKKEKKSR